MYSVDSVENAIRELYFTGVANDLYSRKSMPYSRCSTSWP